MHKLAIARHGGSPELLNRDLLESAVQMPTQTMSGHFLHETIPAMAAAYLFHLTQNHAFADGNKRVGTLACAVFLDINGWQLEIDPQVLQSGVWSIAAGEMSKGEITKLIELHAVECKP